MSGGHFSLAAIYDGKVLALALGICLLTSGTAFQLATNARDGVVSGSGLKQAMAGFVTGGGIWATHFVAMLADTHMPFSYSSGRTLISIVVAMVTSGFAWRIALGGRRTSPIEGGLVMAIGIVTMHFLGMSAMRGADGLSYDEGVVAMAIAVGALSSILSLWIFDRYRHFGILVPAALLALAVCAVHFLSMRAMTGLPLSLKAPDDVTATSILIVLIAALILVILSIALASAILDGRLARNAAEEASRLKGFAESSSEGLAFLSEDMIVDANERFWSMAGHDPLCPPRGLAISELLPAHSLRVAPLRDAADFIETELRLADGSGLAVEVALRRADVRGHSQDLVIVRDVSGRKAAAARIAHLVSHDPLTGAANRYTFNDSLDLAIAAAARGSAPVALLLIAVTPVDDIHARFGHEVGDALLIEATSRIRECIDHHDVLARPSGDLFAIIQVGDGQPRQSSALADQILTSLRDAFIVDGRHLVLDARIGIALYPGDATGRSDLYRCASLALQRARAAETAGYRFFEAAIDQLLIARRERETDLRGAIDGEQLHLHYQPLVCSVTGNVVGFEALLRWQHPIHGNIPPDRFIAMAEEIGAIVPIGRWVLQQACAEAARWAEPVRIAVNLSPVQFAAGDLVATVERVLLETGLSPDRLDLEITEGVLIGDIDRVLPILSAIKALGVGISMDDFGTGYSSLAYFWKFPFDKVKIDRAFVSDMLDHPKAMAIVRMVVGLGKSLGLTVVAEGVETRDQMEALQALGCDQLQGYLIGRPTPIGQFRASAMNRRVERFTCSSGCRKCPGGHGRPMAHNDPMPADMRATHRRVAM